MYNSQCVQSIQHDRKTDRLDIQTDYISDVVTIFVNYVPVDFVRSDYVLTSLLSVIKSVSQERMDFSAAAQWWVRWEEEPVKCLGPSRVNIFKLSEVCAPVEWPCAVYYVSIFVLDLVILCFVYFLFVYWLSVPVQLTTWKDSSPK